VAGRIRVEDLDIEAVHLSKTDSREPTDQMNARTGGVPQLPLALVWENASIQRLWIQVNGSERLLSQLHFSAQMDNKRFQFSRLDLTDQGMHIVMQGSLGLQQPYPVDGELSWHFRDQDGHSIRGQATFEGDPYALNVDHRLYEPHYIETSGQMTIMARPDKQAPVDSKTLLNTDCELAPGILRSLLESNRGCRINFKGHVVGQHFPPMAVHIRSIADLCGISLDEVTANTLGGAVHAHGRIDFGIEPSWKLQVDAMNLDPGKYWAGWFGRIELKADIEGELKSGQPILHMPALKLEGEMLGQPILVEGGMTLQGNNLSMDNLNIRSGDSWFGIGGAVGPYTNASFQCEARDPNHIWPGLTGKFIATGSISGPQENLSTVFHLTGSGVSYKTEYYGKYKLRSLNIGLNTYAGNDTNTENFIKIEHLNIGDYFPIELFDIRWNGNMDHLSASMLFESSPVTGSATFENFYNHNDETMKIHLKSLLMDMIGHGKWQLDESTDMLVSHYEMKPISGCLKRNGRSACIQGFWNNESGWELSGDLNKDPIPYISHLLESLRKEIPLFQMKKAELPSGS
jgi:hypothetical protein